MKKEHIRIGAYSPVMHPDEEHIKAIAEAGINFAILNLDLIPEGKRKDVYSWLDKYGIEATMRKESLMKYYLDNCGLFDFDKANEADFLDEPCFAGYTYVDEPGMDHFEVLGQEIKKFKEIFPEKIPYINLLPMYANAAQLLGGAWKAPIEYYENPPTDFKAYLDKYIECVDTDYICTDIYPCRRVPDPACPEKFPAYYIPTAYPHYCKSIEITADACRKSGRDFWICIQTCSWAKAVREPDGDELRWQFYTMLSYGAKAFLYYIFAERTSHTGAMLNVRGEKTKLFYASKEICEGLHRLSDVYMEYRNLGAFNVNSSPEKTSYLEMNNSYTAFDTISEISADAPILVGCFEKKKGEGHAFTLVNFKDFRDPGTATVKAKIEGKVTVYKDGVPEALAPEECGIYSFTLPQGHGVFVTVE